MGPRIMFRQLLISLVALLFMTSARAEEPKVGLPQPGETLAVEGREAFVILPPSRKPAELTPWIWYAPTLKGLPGGAEKWMFEKFLAAGIAIAGIDVGESYGSPAGVALYSALYRELTEQRHFATRPVLLGRSRGGLMTLSWAVANADKVGGWAGIYPVCNVASYPGIAKACGAYELTTEELTARLGDFNPIDRLAPLAAAGIPLFAIHGDDDRVVPLDANSLQVAQRYWARGGQMQLLRIHEQGHNMWPGFFQCEELVDFVLRHAKP